MSISQLGSNYPYPLWRIGTAHCSTRELSNRSDKESDTLWALGAACCPVPLPSNGNDTAPRRTLGSREPLLLRSHKEAALCFNLQGNQGMVFGASSPRKPQWQTTESSPGHGGGAESDAKETYWFDVETL